MLFYPTRRRNGGFTLVELLTVIVIIGILAAISVAVVGNVKKGTQQTKSLSNLRQIGTAIILFAGDNQQQLPVWHDYTIGQYWWEQIKPFAGGNTDIFGSPSHAEFDDSTRDKICETISYGWNYNVVGRHRGDASMNGDHNFRMIEFPSPSNTLVATDGSQYNSYGFIEVSKPDPKRYPGGITSLFLDGHASVRPVSEFQQTEPWFVPIRNVPWK